MINGAIVQGGTREAIAKQLAGFYRPDLVAEVERAGGTPPSHGIYQNSEGVFGVHAETVIHDEITLRVEDFNQ